MIVVWQFLELHRLLEVGRLPVGRLPSRWFSGAASCSTVYNTVMYNSLYIIHTVKGYLEGVEMRMLHTTKVAATLAFLGSSIIMDARCWYWKPWYCKVFRQWCMELVLNVAMQEICVCVCVCVRACVCACICVRIVCVCVCDDGWCNLCILIAKCATGVQPHPSPRAQSVWLGPGEAA